MIPIRSAQQWQQWQKMSKDEWEGKRGRFEKGGSWPTFGTHRIASAAKRDVGRSYNPFV